MKIKFIFLSILALSINGHSNDFADICNRGKIGNLIAITLGAKSCHNVSVEAMASITELRFNYSDDLETLSENAFQGLSSLKVLDLSINKISTISDNAFNSS